MAVDLVLGYVPLSVDPGWLASVASRFMAHIVVDRNTGNFRIDDIPLAEPLQWP